MSVISCNKTIFSGSLLHDILGHPYLEIFKHVVSTTNKDIVNLNEYELCDSYQLAESYILPILHSHVRSTCLFDIIHMD